MVRGDKEILYRFAEPDSVQTALTLLSCVVALTSLTRGGAAW